MTTRLERHATVETPQVTTNEDAAKEVAEFVTRSVRQARLSVEKVSEILGRAPGGVQGVLLVLGREAAEEAQHALRELAHLANDHGEECVDPLAGVDTSGLAPSAEIETPQERRTREREAARAAREAARGGGA